MTLTLAPEVEERIQDMVNSGRFASPEDVVTHGVDLLTHEDLPNSFRTSGELNSLVDEGLRSAEQEPLLSTSEVRAHLSVRFGTSV